MRVLFALMLALVLAACAIPDEPGGAGSPIAGKDGGIGGTGIAAE